VAAVISLLPKTDRGAEILSELEAQTGTKPKELLDKTRCYYLDALDPAAVDVNAFNPMLDKIDPDWHSHVTNWTPRSALPFFETRARRTAG
jgi:hypothetical protein